MAEAARTWTIPVPSRLSRPKASDNVDRGPEALRVFETLPIGGPTLTLSVISTPLRHSSSAQTRVRDIGSYPGLTKDARTSRRWR